MSEPLTDEQLAAYRESLSVMHADLQELLAVLGMRTGARPETPHVVMQEAIQEVRRLRWEKNAEGATAVEAMEQRQRADKAEAERDRCKEEAKAVAETATLIVEENNLAWRAKVEGLKKDLERVIGNHNERGREIVHLMAERDRYKAVVDAAYQGRATWWDKATREAISVLLDALDQPVREEGEEE